jgi:Secretion system C-terminal sorting domain/FG-GAP-like repeat
MNMNRIAQLFIITLFLSSLIYSQEWYGLDQYWEVEVKGGIYNIETADINRDGHLDIVSGNFNDTYVYFGGAALLDSTVDIVYKGRCLAITDYNGDGIKDMITMHYTKFDSLRHDYDGELLFYFGKSTGQYLFDTVPDYSIPLPTLYPIKEWFAFGHVKPGIRTGDLNNDGKMDLIISSTGWNNVGKLYIYMGKDVPSTTPDFNLESNMPWARHLGDYYEVGDINGDHYDDLLISEKVMARTGPSQDSLAILYLFYGGPNQTYDINNPSFLYKSKTDSYNLTADWFIYTFSLDDINCDGYKDLVVWRTYYKPDSVTAVHYGKPGYDGIDTIANLRLKTPDPTSTLVCGRGVSQNIGDFNSDGNDDFILSGAGMSFWLILGGPHINNTNPYGIRGFYSPDPIFPHKAVPVGVQLSEYERNCFIVNVFQDDISWGHILMFVGNPYVKTDIKREKDTTNNKQNILQVYPNPFNSQIRISYTIKKRGLVNLKLFNSIGQEIEQLKNEDENAGTHEINYRNNKLSSGIYFLTLNHEGQTETQKIVLIK